LGKNQRPHSEHGRLRTMPSELARLRRPRLPREHRPLQRCSGTDPLGAAMPVTAPSTPSPNRVDLFSRAGPGHFCRASKAAVNVRAYEPAREDVDIGTRCEARASDLAQQQATCRRGCGDRAAEPFEAPTLGFGDQLFGSVQDVLSAVGSINVQRDTTNIEGSNVRLRRSEPGPRDVPPRRPLAPFFLAPPARYRYDRHHDRHRRQRHGVVSLSGHARTIVTLAAPSAWPVAPSRPDVVASLADRETRSRAAAAPRAPLPSEKALSA